MMRFFLQLRASICKLSGLEVAILIDVLDEVSLSVAKEIVERLGQVVDHWSTAQVLATGRPLELAGLDHGKMAALCSLPNSGRRQAPAFRRRCHRRWKRE